MSSILITKVQESIMKQICLMLFVVTCFHAPAPAACINLFLLEDSFGPPKQEFQFMQQVENAQIPQSVGVSSGGLSYICNPKRGEDLHQTYPIGSSYFKPLKKKKGKPVIRYLRFARES